MMYEEASSSDVRSTKKHHLLMYEARRSIRSVVFWCPLKQKEKGQNTFRASLWQKEDEIYFRALTYQIFHFFI
jgi:hypothetical protein